ncbi:DNA mismatch repair protein MutS [Sulfurifustis variabilis]|uniref:DNA mismatch repair protein MutS n=1 Tax=Sulfurifustis variabilis TaxID=1675686 RepID=A0A1B4V550_9GAMM|nr:Smr/MutS family protein [Sulfurifustis variabilis]BAU48555.1 DNA mismatch repair protein MutS [Sulfurifustis variabilis]
MASKKIDKEAAALFREHVGKIRPVRQDRIAPHRSKRKPVPEQSLRDAREVMGSLLSDDYDACEIETGEELFHVRPGLQHSVIRKLRRGLYAIEGELDLHGNTVPEARERLDHFIRVMRANGKRCVRIIHGKGKSSEGKMPVLKGKVNTWLRQKDEVLAFCSATPRDGGTGAAYVLLRRN